MRGLPLQFCFYCGEQLFFYNKQFKNDPKLCKSCKAKRYPATKKNTKETQAVCSACGTPTSVPFKPTQGRPVLCRACFQKLQMAPSTPPASEGWNTQARNLEMILSA
jgi:CxxC-x17-CxxC domain-containing protein